MFTGKCFCHFLVIYKDILRSGSWLTLDNTGQTWNRNQVTLYITMIIKDHNLHEYM